MLKTVPSRSLLTTDIGSSRATSLPARSFTTSRCCTPTLVARHTSRLTSRTTTRSIPQPYSRITNTARTFTSTARMGRTESDAFGEIEVPSDRYWGAQTQRSLGNFKINQPQDRMPSPIVRAFGILKGAAATVNMNIAGLGRHSSTISIFAQVWLC